LSCLSGFQVDEEKKELAVGLVDAIGAFTFFKALESKGKQLASKGLANNKGAGQVTVVSSDLSLPLFPVLLKPEIAMLIPTPRISTLASSRSVRSPLRSRDGFLLRREPSLRLSLFIVLLLLSHATDLDLCFLELGLPR